MPRALGITIHTGWGACVVVAGTLRKPEVLVNDIVSVLGEAERFCFHRAAEMPAAERAAWLAHVRRQAVATCRAALGPYLARAPNRCAIVARAGTAPPLEDALRAHTSIHAAEGIFYRDVFCEACEMPVVICSASSLDVSKIGRLAPAPWGKDQKLAALAAWTALASRGNTARGQ